MDPQKNQGDLSKKWTYKVDNPNHTVSEGEYYVTYTSIFLGGDDDFIDLIESIKELTGKRIQEFYFPCRPLKDS